MFSTLSNVPDNYFLNAFAAASATVAATTDIDMDNSLGGADPVASIITPTFPGDIAGDSVEMPLLTTTTFEAEFWRSFAEQQLLDASAAAPPMPPPFAGAFGTDDESAAAHPAAAAASMLFGHHPSGFVPPPPRPPFMDMDTVMSDGLSTCDLCSWAVQEKSAFSFSEGTFAPGELGWAFSIGLVSVVSALIGAIIMITLVRCKRLKSNSNHNHMNHHHLHSGHRHLHHHHLDHHHHRHERGFMSPSGGGIISGNGGGLLGFTGDDTGGMAMSLGLGLGPDDHTDGSGCPDGGGLHPWWCRKQHPDPDAEHGLSDLHSQHHQIHQHQLGGSGMHHHHATMQHHSHENTLPKQRPAHHLIDNGALSPTSGGGGGTSNPQVWIWLKTVHTPPTPEPMPLFPPSASIENYYTNTDTTNDGKVTEVVYEEIAGIG